MAALAVVGCKKGSLAGDGGVGGGPYPTGPFAPRGMVEGINDPYFRDEGPHLRDDQLELFFASNRPETASDGVFDYNLWVSTRPNVASPWSTPIAVTAVSVPTSDETNPVLSSDGLTLYFARDGSVYQATRTDLKTQKWTGTQLVGTVNEPPATTVVSDFLESADGSRILLLGSNRGAGVGSGTYDIWLASSTVARPVWSTRNAGPVVNSVDDDVESTLSADLLTLYFNSNRTTGTFRIYMASRASSSSEFGAPVPATEFDPPTATSNVVHPHLSADGKAMYYVSDDAGTLDLYYATR